jgi:hypothetical protein
VGDLNHDNNTDVVTAQRDANRVGVFLGYGNGLFGSQMIFPVGNSPVWIEVADFNSDNQLDIAVLTRGDNTIGILLGIGDGTFLAQTTYNVSNSSSTYFFTVADINNDGQLDLLIPNPTLNSVQILLGRGDGTFQAEMLFSTGASNWPVEMAVADFNRDNRADIAVVSYGSNEVDIILGTC